MRRKVLTAALLCLVLILGTGSSVFAQNPSMGNDISNFHVDYAKDQGHKNRTHDQIKSDLENEGASPADANFYAKMDILTNQLESKHITLNFDNVEAVDQNYAALHIDEVRERALNLDLPALKRILSSNEALFFGREDVEKSMDLAKSMVVDGQKVGKKITINYPDGSSVTATVKTQKRNENSGLVKTNTLLAGPWNYNSFIFGEYNLSSGWWSSTTEWQFSSGSGYAKVKDLLNWHSDFNGATGTTYYDSDSGAVSCDGAICTVASEVDSNNVNSSAWDNDVHTYGTAIQGYTDGRFTISTSYSGTFNAQFASLSITATTNTYWHEYAITEVAGGKPDVYHWAGEYK